MKIGYYTFANIRIAETFISDLIHGLEKKTDLVWYSGQKSISEQIANKQIAAAFSPYEAPLPNWLFKIGQIKGNNGYHWRMKLRLLLAKKKLDNLRQLPDVAYVEFLTTAIMTREFFEEKNIPYIVHVHGYDITSELNDPAYRKEIKKVFLSVKYIIAASYFIKRLLVLEGCPAEKIEVIRLGVDVDSISPLSWVERKKNRPSIVFLGRLTEKKNPIALLYAFDIVKKQIPEATLTIIGQGYMQKEIESRIETLSLKDSVVMLGALPREKSFSIMNKHWIYAQHSVTSVHGDKEGYAISPAEAAAHELPVVSTIHNGIPEHVINGKTGFLVPEFDYEKMAERMIELLRNPGLCEQMGKAGRENIKVLNDPRKRIDKIYSLLKKVSNK